MPAQRAQTAVIHDFGNRDHAVPDEPSMHCAPFPRRAPLGSAQMNKVGSSHLATTRSKSSYVHIDCRLSNVRYFPVTNVRLSMNGKEQGEERKKERQLCVRLRAHILGKGGVVLLISTPLSDSREA